MGDYKVLVVVDIQNCFIQGGSLGSTDIGDLKKYIDLVKEVDEKISKGNYDLVVFSKDIHPLNHSSLSDNTTPQYGVFEYHCRNTTKNCIKNTENPDGFVVDELLPPNPIIFLIESRLNLSLIQPVILLIDVPILSHMPVIWLVIFESCHHLEAR